MTVHEPDIIQIKYPSLSDRRGEKHHRECRLWYIREISKELDECRQRRCSVAKRLAEFKHPQRAFERALHHHWPKHSSPTTDQQISLHTNCLFQQQHLMSNHFGYEERFYKMSTERLFNLLTLLSRAFAREQSHSFHRIVIGDEIWVDYDDCFSEQEPNVWKKQQLDLATWKDHLLGQIWYSAQRISSRWNYNQRSLLCINDRSFSLCHCRERWWD